MLWKHESFLFDFLRFDPSPDTFVCLSVCVLSRARPMLRAWSGVTVPYRIMIFRVVIKDLGAEASGAKSPHVGTSCGNVTFRQNQMRVSKRNVETLLGLAPHSPSDLVRRVYLERIKQCHPDHSGGMVEDFIRLQQAWQEHRHNGRAAGAAAQRTASHIELLLFSVSGSSVACAPLWTPFRMQSIQTAMMSAVKSTILRSGESHEAPTFWRVGMVDASIVNVELAARSPYHRDTLAAAIARDGTFLGTLQREFVAAGGSDVKLRLKGGVRRYTTGTGTNHCTTLER